jgi:hypothetical protein
MRYVAMDLHNNIAGTVTDVVAVPHAPAMGGAAPHTVCVRRVWNHASETEIGNRVLLVQ